MIELYRGDCLEVMDELVKLNEEGTTIMMVTHDAKVAAKCSRVLYIVDGNIKGEYNSPKEKDVQEKDRERMLNNWLMDFHSAQMDFHSPQMEFHNPQMGGGYLLSS